MMDENEYESERSYTVLSCQFSDLNSSGAPAGPLAKLFLPPTTKITIVLLKDDRGVPSTVTLVGHWTLADLHGSHLTEAELADNDALRELHAQAAAVPPWSALPRLSEERDPAEHSTP
jgi:hypothetical protein